MSILGGDPILVGVRDDPIVRSKTSSTPKNTIYFSSEDGNIHTIDSDKNLLWSYDTGEEEATSLAVDPAGICYTVCGSSQESIHKVSANGEMVWSFTGEGSTVYNFICAGADGAVYVGGTEDGERMVRKIDGDLSPSDSNFLVWMNGDPGRIPRAGDVEGHTLYNGEDGPNVTRTGIRKSGESGATEYFIDISPRPRTMAATPHRLYVGFIDSGGVQAFDTTMSPAEHLWTFHDVSSSVMSVVTDGEHLYAKDHNGDIVKLSIVDDDIPDGEREIWRVSSSSGSIAVAPDGCLYGHTGSGGQIEKRDVGSGALIWEYGYNGTITGIDVTPGRWGAFPEFW